MTKLTKGFVEAMPTAAELLTPAMVGHIITGVSVKEVDTKVAPIKTLHILVCKLDNGTNVEINATAFNSLFFADTDENVDTIEDSQLKALNSKLDSVTKLLDSNPVWEGAKKGLNAFEISKDGEIEFNSYTIVGKRLRTRNGVVTLRPKAYSAYEDESTLSTNNKTPLDMKVVYASSIIKNHPTESFRDLITWEYLLVPVK